MIIFIHPSPKIWITGIPLSKKFVCGRDFSRPENLDSEAILRLVAVTQSGAYLVYVSICGASQMPKEPVIRIFAN